MRKPLPAAVSAPAPLRATGGRPSQLHRPTKVVLIVGGLAFLAVVLHLSSVTSVKSPVDWRTASGLGALAGGTEKTGVRGAPVSVPKPPSLSQDALRKAFYAVEDAKKNRPGGPTPADWSWADLRAEHAREYAGITRHPDPDGVEPFMKTGMRDWQLFRTPEEGWVARAQAVIEAHKTAIEAADDPSLSNEVTIVTALLDLKRADLEDHGQFKRTMQEYYDRFNYILDRGFKMVVFMPYEFKSHLHIQDDRVTIVHFPSEDIKNYFPYYDRVEEVRLSPLWVSQGVQTGWLGKSPQAKLPGYNPLVMSKVYLLRDAAELNPYRTKYFLFVDSGHQCAGAQDPAFMNVYTEHMERGYLVTHWPYGTNSEVHGFNDKAMHVYVGTEKDPLRVVRGGIFGAKAQWIDVVTRVYDIALAETLSDGYMGTEENILAIVFARFPSLFAGYDNNQWGNHGDNCAIFNHQSEIRKAKLAEKAG